MEISIFLDVAPGPTGIGIALLAVIVLAIGFVVLLGGGLFFVLWFRKRRARRPTMNRAEDFPAGGGGHILPSSPNQPQAFRISPPANEARFAITIVIKSR